MYIQYMYMYMYVVYMCVVLECHSNDALSGSHDNSTCQS